jgi:hypothetical protein
MDWCPKEGEKQSIIDEAIRIGTEGEPRIAPILRHRCPNTRRIYIVMDVVEKPFLEEVVPFLQQFLHLKEMEFEYGIDVSIDYSHTAAEKAKIEGVLHGCMLGLFGENGYLGIVDTDEEEHWNKGPDFQYTWFTANTNAKGTVKQ